uniref:Arrestin_C domain-containing protein n=1 Tax=Heterorhabditis bacteriophora TaxID=37862 RepID=A0A1I7WSU8_HETBA
MGELSLQKSGFTPGEKLEVNYRVSNDSSRTKPVAIKLVQSTTYRAKTFAGHEHIKSTKRVILRNDKGEIDQSLTVSCPIVIGSIPQLSELLLHSKARNGHLVACGKSSLKDSPPKQESPTTDNYVQVFLKENEINRNILEKVDKRLIKLKGNEEKKKEFFRFIYKKE